MERFVKGDVVIIPSHFRISQPLNGAQLLSLQHLAETTSSSARLRAARLRDRYAISITDMERDHFTNKATYGRTGFFPPAPA